MRVYSAAEAIGPAWEHTIDLLWRPRRWGTLLKVCLVAVFAMGGSFNFNLPSRGLNGQSSLPGLPSGALAAVAAIGVLFGLLSFVIGVALFYVGSRLQFVLFELVARRSTFVAPAWHYHGGRTWRWIGLQLLLLLALTVLLLPALVPLVLAFVHLSTQHGSVPHAGFPAALFRSLLGYILAFAVLAIAVGSIYLFVKEIALPFMALEDVRIGEAVARVWQFFRAEPGEVVLYLLLRILLTIGGTLSAYLAAGIVTVISALPLALVGALVWFPLHPSPVGRVVAFALIGVLAAVLLVWFLLLTLAAIGTLLTFYRAWSLYFLGGRYPLLGNLLEPPVAVPVWTPPPSLPRDGDDDSSGPDLPFNPVPA